MNIFQNLLRTKVTEDEKIKTKEQSLSLIEGYMVEDSAILDLQSHRKYENFEGKDTVYRFTIKLLSLDFLSKLANDKRVKNVYFASRHSHPRGGADAISLRQNILIEYH